MVRHLFGVFSKTTQKKCNKMAPLSQIFTTEVPKHDEQKEHPCLQNILKFHDCSYLNEKTSYFEHSLCCEVHAKTDFKLKLEACKFASEYKVIQCC